MKILSISNMPIWLWGKNKGIPSIFYPQKEFAKRGYEVHFLCPLKKGDKKREIVDGINIYRFNFPFNIKRRKYIQTSTLLGRIKSSVTRNLNWLFFHIFGTYQGLTIGRKINPDIVYAHSLTSVFPSYLISKKLKAKLVVRLYGIWDYWRWEERWYRIKQFMDYLAFRVSADLFIVTNDGTYGKEVAMSLGVPEGRVRCWRNGIDKQFYEPDNSAREEICKKYNIDPSHKIIVSTSRLIGIYGVDRLISVLPELFDINSECICLICGSGPNKKALENFVEKHNISSKVIFAGIIKRDEIKKILNASDIFVFLSRRWNCTNTMWEAMASGKCIITTKNYAIEEVLTSGENAVLVGGNEIENLPEIIDNILKNDKLRKTLGENAKNRAREILETWSDRTSKEAELLEKLVNEKNEI